MHRLITRMPKATSAPIRAIGAPTGPQRKKKTFALVRDLGSRIRELFESWIAPLKPLELLFFLPHFFFFLEFRWKWRGRFAAFIHIWEMHLFGRTSSSGDDGGGGPREALSKARDLWILFIRLQGFFWLGEGGCLCYYVDFVYVAGRQGRNEPGGRLGRGYYALFL